MPNKLMRFNILPGGLINPEANGQYVRYEDIEPFLERLLTADRLVRDAVKDGSGWPTASIELKARLTAYCCRHLLTVSVPDTPPAGGTEP